MQGTASERDLRTLLCLCSGTSRSSWIHHWNIHQPHQHCRGAAECSVLTWTLQRCPQIPWLPFPHRVHSQVLCLSRAPGRCCIPVFGLLSSDPEAADGPQGPVTPCQDQSQLNGQGVSLPSCCTGVQTAGLGFAGTAPWIFQFIFLSLFPVTHFSSFPQDWCVGITGPCLCALSDLLKIKNSFSLRRSFSSKLIQITSMYELLIANLQNKALHLLADGAASCPNLIDRQGVLPQMSEERKKNPNH